MLHATVLTYCERVLLDSLFLMRIPGINDVKTVKPTVTKNAIVGTLLSKYATLESIMLKRTIIKVDLP